MLQKCVGLVWFREDKKITHHNIRTVQYIHTVHIGNCPSNQDQDLHPTLTYCSSILLSYYETILS